MNVLVINGSPKGDNSITLKTCVYLSLINKEDRYEYVNAASKIGLYEKNFSEVKKQLEEAELILFSYPVYTFIVPSQLHRFIELMKENNVRLKGKYVSQISTSKHFYDITAHRFVRDNCRDMGMKVIEGLSADMDDLLTQKGQKDAAAFYEHVKFCMAEDIYDNSERSFSQPKHVKVTVPDNAEIAEEFRKTAVVVADLSSEDYQLKSMIDRFSYNIEKNGVECRVVNIHDFKFAGGCISCFNCSSKGQCIYKDGFDELLRNEIQKSDAIVIAFSIKDHSMGYRFKMYDDRQFCNGHRTVTMGSPFGYLISGNYSKEENLRMIIEGRAEVGGNYLAGTASDEANPNREIDILAKNLVYAIDNSYVQPANFLGVGGMKIFRDLIYLMRGFMRADHRFFKSHGQYDFPQKQWPKAMAMYLVGALMSSSYLRKKAGSKMNEGMAAPYMKVLDSVRENI